MPPTLLPAQKEKADYLIASPLIKNEIQMLLQCVTKPF